MAAQSQKSTSDRATSNRVRRHAWRLAAEAYKRYVTELDRQLTHGALGVDEIERWRPADLEQSTK